MCQEFFLLLLKDRIVSVLEYGFIMVCTDLPATGIGEGLNFQLVRGPQKLSFRAFSRRRSSLTQSCVDFEVAHLSVFMIWRLLYPEIPTLNVLLYSTCQLVCFFFFPAEGLQQPQADDISENFTQTGWSLSSSLSTRPSTCEGLVPRLTI